MERRIISTEILAEDAKVENSLRPLHLEDYVGQEKVKRNLKVYIEAAKERGNLYGRQEEVFECEDCQGCPLAEQCKKTPKNKRISLSRERNNMYQEVQDNMESIHGALLRMNRSIKAEGTFGIMKHDRWYKRIVRKGIDSVKAELYLVALGYNLRKYITKIMALHGNLGDE